MKELASQFVLAAEGVKRFADVMKQASVHIKLLKMHEMNNLLNCNGRRFSANIAGTETSGKIRVEDGSVYLCQNDKHGAPCADKLDFEFSWTVGEGTPEKLVENSVTDFKLAPMTAEEIEAYKDWQVGNVIAKEDIRFEVIFRSGELVVCKTKYGDATPNYTCDELHRAGYRLVAEPEPEEGIVKVTMDEIAEKMGVPVERLRVKKEE